MTGYVRPFCSYMFLDRDQRYSYPPKRLRDESFALASGRLIHLKQKCSLCDIHSFHFHTEMGLLK